MVKRQAIVKENKVTIGSRVKTCLSVHKKDILQVFILSLVMAAICGAQSAFAAGDLSQLTNGFPKLKSFMKAIVGVIGVLIFGYGGVTFGIGFTQDQPDAQSRGVKYLIGGAVILCIDIFAAVFGISNW